MCGIFGVIYFDGQPVPEKVLSKMADHMRHRGPDDQGLWLGDSVALGMRRLSIVDIEGGQQPITNEDDTVVIVLNGEIYNFRELQNELLRKGHIFKTHSDVECVLHLYEEMGIRCLERINGMFALAIFDKKQNRLWLARDRLGIKPLFYKHLKNGFAFSSDLSSLASISEVSIDRTALIAYLGFSYTPEPNTIYANLKKITTSRANTN